MGYGGIKEVKPWRTLMKEWAGLERDSGQEKMQRGNNEAHRATVCHMWSASFRLERNRIVLILLLSFCTQWPLYPIQMLSHRFYLYKDNNVEL